MLNLFSLLCTSYGSYGLYETKVRYGYVICREMFAYMDLTILNEFLPY